jgi:hypothetical protein
MSGSVKLGIIILCAVLFGGIVIRMLFGLVTNLLAIITPLAIIAGIGLIAYGLINRRALGGGRRYLP